MSTEKHISARIQHKHDIEANWLKATTFIPKAGELIVYDIETANDPLPTQEGYIRTERRTSPQVKIGDGKTNVNDLPFVTSGSSNIDYENVALITVADIDAICGTTIIDATNNSEVTF